MRWRRESPRLLASVLRLLFPPKHSLGHSAEQRAFGPHGGAGGPVEVRRRTPVAEPGFQCGGRAAAGLGRVGVYRDALAGADLVGLLAGDGEHEAAAGDRFHGAEGEGDQLGAAVAFPCSCDSAKPRTFTAEMSPGSCDAGFHDGAGAHAWHAVDGTAQPASRVATARR
jgi:hypothetical protein